jgi:predicted ATP-grasp superfamily ATP-dependent carboligase
MIQEYIPGKDSESVNYNSYYINGEPVAEFTAQKVRLSPPEFGVPRVVVSKKIPEIVEPGRRILKALGFYGYSCIEFKKDQRDGEYKFMDLNGRHNRSGLLALRAGIDFAWIQYKHLNQEKFPVNCSSKSGTFWIEEFRDAIHSVKLFFKEKYSLADYMRPYAKAHIFAIFDLKDLRPFVKRCFDLAHFGLKRIFRSAGEDTICSNSRPKVI